MELIDSLKFVQGAISKKDFVPILTCFSISNRTVKGFNGTLGLSAPISLDFNIFPKATEFVQAIDSCSETITLSVSKNGKLIIQSGTFKTFVNCDAVNKFPDLDPKGTYLELGDSLIPALKYLEPFIAQDASRPWACSILFDNESAFATNNIMVVEYWLGFKVPQRISIPVSAVKQLIRINEDPVRLQISDNRLVFHFENNRWLSTQLIRSEWPDVRQRFDKDSGFGQQPYGKGFFEALEQLLPFTDELNRVFFNGDRITTVKEWENAGSSVETACPSEGCFNAKQLLNIRDISNTIAFDHYPDPVFFYGERCRGMIAGIKQ